MRLRNYLHEARKHIAMRELRNIIAHEYPYEEELQQESFLLALQLSDEFIKIVKRIENATHI